jgi:Protein of unknown function (DUF3759)
MGTDQARPEHKAKFTHELVSGAAGFEAMRMYEKHCRENGAPQSHALMKELLAGFAAAETDKLVETKGMDWIDTRKAKEQAAQQAEQFAMEMFGQGNVAPPNGW